MCGEKIPPVLYLNYSIGSPPRVRGKGSIFRWRKSRNRITPACAGKSVLFNQFFCSVQDHPRVCGEKSSIWYMIEIFQGSPPRVRGKVDDPPLIPIWVRITPACAGKSTKESVWTSWIWDHPRVCGEKEDEVLTDALELGSPPRVRGKD